MFVALSEAIEGLDLALDGDDLATVARLADRLTAKVTMAAAAFDAAELWDTEGATSMMAWLRDRARMTNRDARRMAGIGRRLRTCPVTAAAWVDGSLSTGQVQVITANVKDRTAGLYAEHEADLVPQLAKLDLGDTTTAMQSWASKAEALLDDEPKEPTGTAHLSPLLDGRGQLDATLTPEGFQLARKALLLATGGKASDDTRSPAERLHDGLTTVFRFFLDNQDTATGGHHRPHLNIVIDHDALVAGKGQGTLVDSGGVITAADALRHACDANVHRFITQGKSTTLDYGRATRTVPANLFTVIARRDRGCRFPGCDRPVAWAQAHHLKHWIRGGPTDETNCALFCDCHHHVIHRPGWHVEMHPTTGRITVTDPNGRIRTSDPPTPTDHAHAA